jgi:hypothetical protein
MKRLSDVMDEVGREALLKWLKGNALEIEAELRDAGWEEDGRGLWSCGEHKRLHLFDAHEVATREEA